jgi:GTP cyclohydrolase II
MKHPHELAPQRYNRDAIAVERALAEFRAGRPVILVHDSETLLVSGVEGLDESLCRDFELLGEQRSRLVMPAARLRRLGLERTAAGSVALPIVELARIQTLALRIDARIDAPVSPARAADEVALELARMALTAPTVVVAPVDPALLPDDVFLSVRSEAIMGYRPAEAAGIAIIGRAPVPLEGAAHTEFVVFRGGEGLRDQVAIIVGKPDFAHPVHVRMHSACLTGDLFGSLKCDCGDQLRETVQWMADNDGGILLYLDQEGRGNGIANKMKAYNLQAQGWDTYDADEVLGFDLDQRRFDFAAEMLRQLGVSTVSLMTNNPEKIGALKAAGLDLVSEKRVFGRPNPNNVRYLASKRDRAGHFIDFDAIAARQPAE